MQDIKGFVFDTETASLQGGVCEIAISGITENLDVVWQATSLIDPECPISPSAMGIHHITDDMVYTAPTLSEFMDLASHPFDREDLLLIGHNVQFDVRMVSEHLPETFRQLCTLKLSRNLWPELENHKLQTLRYTFKLDAGDAHRAAGDVATTVSLLRMVAHERGCGLDQIIEMARKPLSLDTKMPFGKHKDTKLRALPLSYVRWLTENTDNLDADLREALESRLT